MDTSSKRRPYQYVADEVDLPLPVAIWVIFAHMLVALSPLYMMLVVFQNWDYLQNSTYAPHMFYVAAGLFLCGSPFEIAQNTLDKWYLTKECGSCEGFGFCDFLSWLFVTAGMVSLTIAVGGDSLWLVFISVSALIIYPIVYLIVGLPYPTLGIAGITASLAMYFEFNNPLMFALVLSPLALMYFLTALFETGNQVLHGFVTLAGGSGLLIVAWAMGYSINNTPHTWLEFSVCLMVLSILGFIFRPIIRAFPRTNRRLIPATSNGYDPVTLT